MGLNDDELDGYENYSEVNCTEDNNKNQEDYIDYDIATSDTHIPVNALEQIMNAKRDELLMTLLDVVEKLSVKVFGDQKVTILLDPLIQQMNG